MFPTHHAPGLPAQYELRFRSLYREGHSLSFPCDQAGQVRLDDMSERARTNYFFARTVVGREYATPAVRPAFAH
jgi:hypothetical protein